MKLTIQIFIDVLYAETLTCQYGRDVDAFAVHAATPASGGEHVAIIERTRAKGHVQAEFVRIA